MRIQGHLAAMIVERGLAQATSYHSLQHRHYQQYPSPSPQGVLELCLFPPERGLLGRKLSVRVDGHLPELPRRRLVLRPIKVEDDVTHRKTKPGNE